MLSAVTNVYTSIYSPIERSCDRSRPFDSLIHCTYRNMKSGVRRWSLFKRDKAALKFKRAPIGSPVNWSATINRFHNRFVNPRTHTHTHIRSESSERKFSTSKVFIVYHITLTDCSVTRWNLRKKFHDVTSILDWARSTFLIDTCGDTGGDVSVCVIHQYT